ncbi:MAG: hypothetical protein EGS63_01160 [Lachnospira sp.]|nr:hypothetical protein [Lachnospira sp.]
MESFTIRLAGQYFEICPVYDYIREYCKDYIVADVTGQSGIADGDTEHTSSGVGDITTESVTRIRITQSDIDFEREKSAREDIKEGIPIRQFYDAYLETLAVYRKIADHLLSCDTLLFHGSVIAVDGIGYLFTAKSGTGKSTHTRLWREYFGERAVMVNDDKPLLRITDSGVTAYGTPWDGKHRLSTNIAVPLNGICILTRDTTNHIEQAEPHAVYPLIVQQTNRSLSSDGMKQTLSLIDRMLNVVPVYRLGCNMDIEAARVAYEGMNRLKKQEES